MFMTIVRHTPGWVWGLLLMLIALGIWQARDRRISLGRLTILPLVLLGLSLSGVFSAFGHAPIALGGWAAGIAVALACGRQLFSTHRAAWCESSAELHVPGSWAPLGLMVGLFTVKYIASISLAMNTDLSSDPAFAGPTSLAYGIFSGLFLARALALRRLARQRSGPSCA